MTEQFASNICPQTSSAENLECLSQKPFFENRFGWWLLLALPISALLTYLLHLQLVDMNWLYLSYLSTNTENHSAIELANQMAAHGLWWHLGKNGFWPIILLCIETLAIGMLCTATGQLLGVNAKLRHLFLLGLWSKSPFLLGALAIVLRLALQDLPTHIQTDALNPLSWYYLMDFKKPGPLPFLASIQSPTIVLSVAILAWGFKQLSGRSWLHSCIFAMLPYTLCVGSQYYLLSLI